jgi:hypothetical protein
MPSAAFRHFATRTAFTDESFSSSGNPDADTQTFTVSGLLTAPENKWLYSER